LRLGGQDLFNGITQQKAQADRKKRCRLAQDIASKSNLASCTAYLAAD